MKLDHFNINHNNIICLKLSSEMSDKITTIEIFCCQESNHRDFHGGF